VDIPVRCVRCGVTGTTSKLIGGHNVTNMTLSNVTLGNACPRCGGDLKVIDGTYDSRTAS
jgi:DNA-directed RNA polymerase subunit RPC12/RpoP